MQANFSLEFLLLLLISWKSDCQSGDAIMDGQRIYAHLHSSVECMMRATDLSVICVNARKSVDCVLSM